MNLKAGFFGLLAASAALLAAPVEARMSQAEEDALVARVEARIRYALSQPQHRTDTHPLGVMPLPQNYEDDAITADGLIISPTGRTMQAARSEPAPPVPAPVDATPPEAEDPSGGNSTTTTKLKDQTAISVEYIDTDEVTCIARTMVREVVATQDAEVHAAAVAEAFRLACEKGDNVTVSDFDDVFQSEDAFAFAATMAKVMLTCSGTTDSVYKCVSITATANAYAEATVEAHASAVANAVNACGCLTEAVSQGMNSADVYVKLVAEAASTATAEVCVTGTKLVKAEAFDFCVSSVYGEVFAEATANAIVQGQCLSAVAIADVLAEASVDVTADSSCGLTATAFEFDPVSDGPVADTSAEDTAAVVAETPLPNPEEEQKAEKLEETIVETTPVADVPEASDVPEVVPEEPKPEEVVPPAEPEGPRPTEPETEPDVAAPAEPVVAPAEPVVAPEEPKPVLDRQVQAGGASRVPPGDTAGPWEQCGGKGWEGPTKCVDTFVCVAQEGNIWYSQCREATEVSY